MTIGELARTTGCGIETIRYYEHEGLLPKPGRTSGNFRRYGQEHAELLSFIRHCRALDMALNEIRILLRFRAAPNENCREVNALLDTHLSRGRAYCETAKVEASASGAAGQMQQRETVGAVQGFAGTSRDTRWPGHIRRQSCTAYAFD